MSFKLKLKVLSKQEYKQYTLFTQKLKSILLLEEGFNCLAHNKLSALQVLS